MQKRFGLCCTQSERLADLIYDLEAKQAGNFVLINSKDDSSFAIAQQIANMLNRNGIPIRSFEPYVKVKRGDIWIFIGILQP